jgi:hypothetical protein
MSFLIAGSLAGGSWIWDCHSLSSPDSSACIAELEETATIASVAYRHFAQARSER